MSIPKKILKPFKENNNNIKWLKLFEIAEEIDEKELKKLSKYISKATPSKYKKSFLLILAAAYMENDFTNWNKVKARINSLKQISLLKEKKYLEPKNQNGKIEEKYKEMFINIGKDKKIYPKHLLQFIQDSMKIKSEQVRNIRIYDKFSFFSIPEHLSEKAIILLSVKKFRGKNINVNLSKQSKQ